MWTRRYSDVSETFFLSVTQRPFSDTRSLQWRGGDFVRPGRELLTEFPCTLAPSRNHPRKTFHA
jgi:hypothetical protein